MSTPALIDDAFPRFTEDEWRALAATSIGAETLDSLVSRSDDGIAIGPIHGRSDSQSIADDGTPAPWTITERVDAADAGEAAARIATALAGGARGTELIFDGSPIARGAGLSADRDSLDRLVRGMPIGGMRLRIDAAEATTEILARLSGPNQSADPADAGLAFSFDPASTLAARGWLARPYEACADDVLTATDRLEGRGSAIIADGRPWHDGGASEAQELAAVLSAIVGFLHQAERTGRDLERLAGRIGVALAADADQFLTIAKFRAARLLAARVFGLCGLAEAPCHIHAETAWRMLSRRDPHTNMLRTTAATLAAAVGVADSITVLPFTPGDDDAFARRMARNTQLILMEEAHLARVADPGAGAGALDALTTALAEAAWEQFRGIEADGGLLAAVRAGSIQRAVAEKRDERLRRVAAREIELVGVNVFVNGDSAPARAERPTAATAERPAAPAEAAEPLTAVRLAKSFEDGDG